MVHLRIAGCLAVAALAACAHTSIASTPDDCGTFSSEVTGVPPLSTPAGQFNDYQRACAEKRFNAAVADRRQLWRDGARAILAAQEAQRTAIETQRTAPEGIADALADHLARARPAANRTTCRIAVLPPTCRTTADACAVVRDRIEARLTARSACTLLERQRLDAVLREQRRSLSDMVDEATAARIGVVSGATDVLITDIRPIGATGAPGGPSVHIAARIVDAERAQIVVAAAQTFQP